MPRFTTFKPRRSSVPSNGAPLVGGLQPMQVQQPFNYPPAGQQQQTPGLAPFTSQGVSTVVGPNAGSMGTLAPGMEQQQTQAGGLQGPLNPANPIPNLAPGTLANPFGSTPFQTPGLRTPATPKARPNMFGYRR